MRGIHAGLHGTILRILRVQRLDKKRPVSGIPVLVVSYAGSQMYIASESATVLGIVKEIIQSATRLDERIQTVSYRYFEKCPFIAEYYARIAGADVYIGLTVGG